MDQEALIGEPATRGQTADSVFDAVAAPLANASAPDRAPAFILALDVRRRRPLDLPAGVEGVRLKLRCRGRKLGTIELPVSPDGASDDEIWREIDERALPALLPAYLRRNAWRDLRLARRLLRLTAEKRTLRILWELLHVHPRRWRTEISAFLASRHAALLGVKRAQAPIDPAPRRARPAGSAAQPDMDAERARWEGIFSTPDPWGYGGAYERLKYEQTLALLPDTPVARALELACAEGHFTVQLAPKVGALLAADISAAALERAKVRCAGLANTEFLRLNFRNEPLPPGPFDLIVCSEVLYFLDHRFELRRIARKFARALEPGGYLLMAHANVVVDDASVTGWDWPVGFGAKVIGETFAQVRALEFVREVRTPVYRVQLFRRRCGDAAPVIRSRRRVPREVVEAPSAAEPGRTIHWGGCAVTRSAAAHVWMTRALPILMYHRISRDAPEGLTRYQIRPEQFERQLAYLRRHGYRSISLDEWTRALAENDGRIPDRVVAITFDDAYRDFLTEAWPLLKTHCFRATVFVPTDHVGGSAEWDRAFGEPAPLLGWDEMRALAADGVAFGAHGGSHDYLSRLDTARVLDEGRRSRALLEENLGRPVTAMSYPFGDQDARVRMAMFACGYRVAVTTESSLSRLGDDPMALPRQEIRGDEGFEAFVAKLGRPARATIDRRLRYGWCRVVGRNLQ